MFYYEVYLPINLMKDFCYCSPLEIPEGARVLVSFNRKDIIGICGTRLDNAPQKDIRYKQIIEILDQQPILDSTLMSLAKWMGEYYYCSTGIACFAMLPAWLIPDIQAEVRWVADNIPEEYKELANAFSEGQYQKVNDLRKKLKSKPVLQWIERASEEGYLEIKRKLSPRDKPKTVNYIRVLNSSADPNNLPPKQKEALQLILTKSQEEFPLSEISRDISYSVVHALERKGIISIFPRKVEREFFHFETSGVRKVVTLNEEQERAIQEILQHKGHFQVHLLYGITGSGKTEVYIPIIRSYLQKGEGVIFLIPEIALTPQMVERFQAEFGDILAISHSQLSDRQRLEQWQRIAKGECRLVIGARSAIFSPVQNLGLIIVDEEHEQSYKQENNPRYNGRDVAVMRGKISDAQVILGSATPSLESWYNQKKGKYQLHCLNSRPLDIKLPRVQIISLCEDYSQQMFSDELIAAIAVRLERKEQVILFQNRRGFSSYMQCLKCGELIKCPNCDISMYYHRDREEMQCHYCGNTYPSPRKCPKCGSYSFIYGSPGTQKVEQTLRILFPQARILRLDSDSARQQDIYKVMYRRMKDKEVDILLGTQMISKGLDFPNVTLVGIVNADISLNIPDFRAAERTFQLCTQVAGRSGRADKEGEVIIQTYNPGHYAIIYASNQDFPGFAEEELSHRRHLYYPPYYRLARILFQSADNNVMQEEMDELSQKIQNLTDTFSPGEIFLLGPAPAPFTRMKNLYRWHLIFKGRTAKSIKKAINAVLDDYKVSSTIHYTVDIDPTTLM
jgi:primosomal protein N' (replication factor Y)